MKSAAVSTSGLDRIRRDLRTASYLSREQLGWRANAMARRRVYSLAPSWPIARARAAARGCRPRDLPALPAEIVCADGASQIAARQANVERNLFSFLGTTRDYGAGIDWRDPDVSPLWAFQMHYLGALVDGAMLGRPAPARRVLTSWAARFGERWDPVAWHPYTVSLRLTNLCLAAGYQGGFEAIGPLATDLAATHAAFLADHLERDLGGNHLLENAVALAFAGRAFVGEPAERWQRLAREILTAEIRTQILPDGGHFELSPMYHALVLQRLLQLVALWGADDPLVRSVLAPAVARMSRWLAAVCCPDGDIPQLGDSVREFAPRPERLLTLARDLVGTVPEAPAEGVTALPSSGIFVLRRGPLWAILDAGPVCPDSLPGHGQADSLTIEVWIDRWCVVCDPGVHEYSGPLRAWGRSSRAHSTVTIDDADTSEVYGSFRVGGRATVENVRATGCEVVAAMRPSGSTGRVERRVALDTSNGLRLLVDDTVTGVAADRARSRLHLGDGVPATAVGGVEADGVGGLPGRVHIAAGLPAGGSGIRMSASETVERERGIRSRRFGDVETTTILAARLAATASDVGHHRWSLAAS